MNLRLKEIRQNLKLTQKEFSQKIGIKQNTLLRLEKGYSKITKKRIKLICSNFGINENWLLNGNGEIFNKSKTEILADNKKDLEKEIKENITKINNDLITLKESINKYFNS